MNTRDIKLEENEYVTKAMKEINRLLTTGEYEDKVIKQTLITLLEATPDKLDDIFKRQNELLQKYIPIESRNGRDFPSSAPIRDFNSPKIQAFLKDEIFRVIVEMAEAADCLKNKYWKNDNIPTDIDHFMEELADAFHFFIELMIWIGVNPERLWELYMKKNAVNHFRQRSNY